MIPGFILRFRSALRSPDFRYRMADEKFFINFYDHLAISECLDDDSLNGNAGSYHYCAKH